jgi:hypothetical protein
MNLVPLYGTLRMLPMRTEASFHDRCHGHRSRTFLIRVYTNHTRLQEIGPNYGYFPELSKSVLIVSQDNLEAAKSAFKDLDFEVTTGHRYLGGFLGDKDTLTTWIQEKAHNWAEAVKELASAAKNYP